VMLICAALAALSSVSAWWSIDDRRGVRVPAGAPSRNVRETSS
jgi:hypothetical protein